MNVAVAILSALLAAGAASAAPHAASFEEAVKLFEFQAKDPEVKAYFQAWTEFNNANHLDEKGGCWEKPGGAVVQILELDAKGTVVGYFADKDNERTRCWREAYLGVT